MPAHEFRHSMSSSLDGGFDLVDCDIRLHLGGILVGSRINLGNWLLYPIRLGRRQGQSGRLVDLCCGCEAARWYWSLLTLLVLVDAHRQDQAKLRTAHPGSWFHSLIIW